MKGTIIQKNLRVIFLILGLSILITCNKDRDQVLPSDITNQQIHFTGSDSSSSKTTLNGFITSWVASQDKVGIYSTQARTSTGGGGSEVVNSEHTATSSGVGSAFTATSPIYWGAASSSHTFYSYYPYITGTAYTTEVPITLASSQTQSDKNNTAHIGALAFLVATPTEVTSPANTDHISSAVNLKYNHVFTVLEFQIKGSGDLKAVKLVGTASPLAFTGGTIDITQSIPASGVAYTLSNLIGSTVETVVTLTTPATLTTNNADTKVYMVINPSTQTGNYLIGLSSDGTTWNYISRAAPTGGFLRGSKYVVKVDQANAAQLKDQQNNVFDIVTIGMQTWMKRNLNVTKYNNGTAILEIADNMIWIGLAEGAYCNYNNIVNNSTTYGKLYNWFAVNTGKLCPTGWHVPTDEEWTTLTTYLGGASVAGGKLKEAGTAHWTTPNPADNSSGFTALPGGYRISNGSYSNMGIYGHWWSSSQYNTNAWTRGMSNSTSIVSRGDYSKLSGYSVRCLKNYN